MLEILISRTIKIFKNTFQNIDNDINISLAISIFLHFSKYLDICPICQNFSNVTCLSAHKVKIKTLPYSRTPKSI
jgi:hypothetical protein